MALTYDVVTRTTQDLMTAAELTVKGDDSWELVGIIQNDLTVIYIFKK